jgi:hypothetical protein
MINFLPARGNFVLGFIEAKATLQNNRRMSMLVFWVVTPCKLVDRKNLSEEHTASKFIPEDGAIMFLRNMVSTYST